MKLEHAVWSALSLALIPACGNSPQVAETAEALESATAATSCDNACFAWPQWGRSADHEGNTCVRGQRSAQVLDDLVFDPFVAKEQAEIVVLQTYLPAQMSDGEIDALIAEAVASTGAASIKDMGKVMAAVKAKAQGRADMGAVGARIKARLSA